MHLYLNSALKGQSSVEPKFYFCYLKIKCLKNAIQNYKQESRILILLIVYIIQWYSEILKGNAIAIGRNFTTLLPIPASLNQKQCDVFNF